jgi:broad specificity phosphatase PhoE
MHEHCREDGSVEKCGKVFIARHGERADFVDKKWLAEAESPYDPPLTPNGLLQARELGLRLKGEGITHIYASPFHRTAQTAHQVADVLQLSVKIECGLAEALLARLFPQGLPRLQTPEQLKHSLPRIDETYRPAVNLDFPESYDDARRRCARIAHHLASMHPSDNILLVGHGLSVEYLAVALVPDQPCELHIPYCCLTECVRRPDGRWAYGVHMQHDFLSIKQEKTEADKQRELWVGGETTCTSNTPGPVTCA